MQSLKKEYDSYNLLYKNAEETITELETVLREKRITHKKLSSIDNFNDEITDALYK